VKRGKPLKRTTPLVRRKEWRRKAPRSWDRWQKVRAATVVRAEGICDLCGEVLGDRFDCHHRRRRSQGGLDDPAWCVALHRRCHGWVHEHPAAAHRIGFLVRTGEDPTTRPVLLRRVAWVLPTVRGWQPATPLPDQEGASGW
jgi:5-methylcytosine-specific restriction endonuclease McrA